MNEEVHVLVADRTDTVIAIGTYEECEFARNAMISYGVSEDRTFIVPREHWVKSLTEET